MLTASKMLAQEESVDKYRQRDLIASHVLRLGVHLFGRNNNINRRRLIDSEGWDFRESDSAGLVNRTAGPVCSEKSRQGVLCTSSSSSESSGRCSKLSSVVRALTT